jgi:hypothetical protein
MLGEKLVCLMAYWWGITTNCRIDVRDIVIRGGITII